jgi:hypothetical protein
MKYPLETRREVTDLVSGEIALHKAGESKGFTPYSVLAERFGVSRGTITNWVRAEIPEEDFQYRVMGVRTAMTENMACSPELKKEITDLVASEIEQHKAGDINAFTTSTALTAQYGVSKSSIWKWAGAVIPPEDLQYRARIITENVLDHISPDVQDRLKRERSITMKKVRADQRVAREDYLGPLEDSDDLFDLLREYKL